MLWRLITHHEYPDDALQWYLNHSLIALGWGDIGDLQNQQINCQTDISVLCNQVYGPGNTGECGRCLWDFWQIMATGDLVILGTGGGYRACVVEVVGNYFFDITYPPSVNAQRLDGYYYRREVKLTNYNADVLWRRSNLAPGANIRFALCSRI